MKTFFKLLGFCFLLIVIESCSYSKSNQQVLVSSDCGVSWTQINAGESVPKGGLNYCYMKVVIPNFPMQGDMDFVANLAEKVRVKTLIDYDYSITGAIQFIKQAKFLGKANKDADDNAALDPSAFEGAENIVIDKRIKDVAKALFINEDIIEMDQQDLENKLLQESNKVLEPLGVHLNFITLTFDPDEQTRQAIDVSTAMKIYKSKGLEDLGKQVISARAGATKVSVENKVLPASPPAE
ncbi:hypothetical protein GVN16_05480 [Emticicia sp. CRIBPO]|uniref:hypothetical protein n=1 Tax=Emticicia sp. CRIBPO TaxID=2683258 RepID=UPI001411D200|nr:hypothetical protein [Emticicia sp. CRIBPO]NBA85200.1 hypothetical protein [Emticicia sp. CRIBPO]